jgi:hypothetical protein
MLDGRHLGTQHFGKDARSTISTNVDDVLYRGRLLSVDDSGCIYSWDIECPDEYTLRMGHLCKPHKRFEESPEITFYLAKSPVDELLVICVQW